MSCTAGSKRAARWKPPGPFRGRGLFQQWLDGPAERALPAPEETYDKKYPWLAITRRYVRPGMSHDLDEMRAAIARGWGADASGKLRARGAP
ncbi:MAG: hypothetical protein U1F87_10135 [Kiritimatiellia bacterium]